MRVEVVALDGTALRGRVVSVAPELRLQRETPGDDVAGGAVAAAAGDGETIDLDWSELLEVRPLDEPGEAVEAAFHPLRFTLSDGSRFGGRVQTHDGRRVVLRIRSGQTVEVDLSWIVRIDSTTAEAAALKLLEGAAGEADRVGDVAVVAKGAKVAQLRGETKALDQRVVTFVWNDRTLQLPWERVAGLVFASPVPRRAQLVVVLRNGERFAGRVVGGDGAAIVLDSELLGRLPLAWEHIAEIRCRSDRVVYLSDVRPGEYAFEPMFAKRWPYAVDRTFDGQPLRLGGRTYAQGIVMHSRARLRYEIGGRFTAFAATAGILDQMGRRGDVRMAVIGDGRELWSAEHIRGGERPRGVRVDIEGVKVLELQVDYGDDLDLSDQACWARARLVR